MRNDEPNNAKPKETEVPPPERRTPVPAEPGDWAGAEDKLEPVNGLEPPENPEPGAPAYRTESHAPPPRRRSPVWAWLGGIFLVLLLAAGAAVFYVYRQLSPADPAATQTVEFEVMPGWGAVRVSQELEAQDLIRDAQIFRYYLRYQNLDRSIGEGLYDLSAAMDADAIARTLASSGRPRIVRVVIPEGYRATDIAERFETAGIGERESFMALINEPGELRPDFVPEDATLEGYLFPASYEVPVRSTPQQVIGMMLRRFQQELTPEVLEALQALGMSVHEWVTFSSIIQAEAGSEAEMPIITGVFLNRLDRGMLLQADPTVAYGLGKRLNELDRFAGDFTPEADHPWNTYTRPGLPVGPIGSPGRAALRAVFAPERSDEAGRDWLYFLHTRDQRFIPNLSLEDHNRDVQRYLR